MLLNSLHTAALSDPLKQFIAISPFTHLPTSVFIATSPFTHLLKATGTLCVCNHSSHYSTGSVDSSERTVTGSTLCNSRSIRLVHLDPYVRMEEVTLALNLRANLLQVRVLLPPLWKRSCPLLLTCEVLGRLNTL